jgi:hypothetical protein
MKTSKNVISMWRIERDACGWKIKDGRGELALEIQK